MQRIIEEIFKFKSKIIRYSTKYSVKSIELLGIGGKSGISLKKRDKYQLLPKWYRSIKT